MAAQRVRFDIGEHYFHARLRKGATEREPDAARPACHACRLAGKLPHDSPLPPLDATRPVVSFRDLGAAEVEFTS